MAFLVGGHYRLVVVFHSGLLGVDFYISATDFLEIEIYYNKSKFFLSKEEIFSLFSLKKELSMGGLLHFRYRLHRD